MSPEAPPVSEHNGRKYRSKKQRPCDLCRSRKIQCKLQGSEAACELCKRLDQQCTYILGPVRRTYRPRAEQGQSMKHGGEMVLGVGSGQRQQRQIQGQEVDAPMSGTVDHGRDAIQVLNSTSFDWLPLHQDHVDQIFTPRTTSNLLTANWPDVDFPMDTLPGELPFPETHEVGSHAHSLNNRIVHRRESQVTTSSPSTSLSNGQDRDRQPNLNHQHATATEQRIEHQHGLGGDTRLDWPPDLSLDAAQKGYSNMLVGLSSEFDPFFLRHYLYDVHDTYRMFRLHIRKVVDDEAMPRRDYATTTVDGPQPCSSGPAPVQFVIIDEEIWKDEVKSAENIFAEASSHQSDAQLLNKLVPTDLGARLLKLYADQPAKNTACEILTFTFQGILNLFTHRFQSSPSPTYTRCHPNLKLFRQCSLVYAALSTPWQHPSLSLMMSSASLRAIWRCPQMICGILPFEATIALAASRICRYCSCVFYSSRCRPGTLSSPSPQVFGLCLAPPLP